MLIDPEHDRQTIGWALLTSLLVHVALLSVYAMSMPWAHRPLPGPATILVELHDPPAARPEMRPPAATRPEVKTPPKVPPAPTGKAAPKKTGRNSVVTNDRAGTIAEAPVSSREDDRQAKLPETTVQVESVARPGDAGRNPTVTGTGRPEPELDAGWEQRYIDDIRSLIEKSKTYPVMALRGRQQGKVMVGFTLGRQGELLECRLVRSCGHALLDRAALRAVESVGRFPPLPERHGRDQARFVIPVAFVLER